MGGFFWVCLLPTKISVGAYMCCVEVIDKRIHYRVSFFPHRILFTNITFVCHTLFTISSTCTLIEHFICSVLNDQSCCHILTGHPVAIHDE